MRRTLGLLAVAASLTVASISSAQSAPNPEAVKHFQEGKKWRDEGRCDLAIKELELSVKIEPSIGGHYNLGVCYEKSNKKLSLANYDKALELAKERGDDRAREIRAQREEFLDKTPHLRLALPQPLPPDIRVSVDGEALPRDELQSETTHFLGADKPSYDVRVTASGYDDVKLIVDASKIKKKTLITVVMRRQSDGATLQQPPREPQTQWGTFQFLGLGLIALGAAGITYSTVAFISYKSESDNLLDKFNSATADAEGCGATQTDNGCPTKIKTREDLRGQYNSNEDDAKSKRPLWLTLGVGGILAVGGGVVLIIFGPKPVADPGDTAKAPKPTFRLVPQIGAHEQGAFLVGTF